MGKTFDRQAWQEAKQEKLEAAQAALERGLRNLETSDDWKAMLANLAKLGHLSIARLSFMNALIVLSEKPGAAQVATYETWQRYGRFVRKGERSISIRRPVYSRVEDDQQNPAAARPRRLVGFRPLPVFSLEQTEGEPLPTVAPPTVDADEAFADSVEKLRYVALALEGGVVSTIDVRPRAATDHPSALGWYSPITGEIVVVETGSRAMQFKVLCHELAHALLHGDGDHHSTPKREVEAESTAFVVCQMLGLDTADVSFPYVATWARGEDPLAMIAKSGQRILGAAQRLIDALVPTLPVAVSEAA